MIFNTPAHDKKATWKKKLKTRIERNRENERDAERCKVVRYRPCM